MTEVFVVVALMDYSPSTVDSVFSTREAAEKRAEELRKTQVSFEEVEILSFVLQ